jgi:TolB protein
MPGAWHSYRAPPRKPLHAVAAVTALAVLLFAMAACSTGVGTTDETANLGATQPRESRVLVVLDRRQAGAQNHDLWLGNSDGVVLRRLTTSNGDEQTGRFSPDGRQIVYRSAAGPEMAPDIWLMNADGSGKRNLTRTTNATEWSPEWTHDGRRIVFSCSPASGGAGVGNDLCIMNRDGTARRSLISSRQGSEEYPTFDPTGTRFAYIYFTARSNFQIWIANANGANRHAIATDPAGDTWPAWSPDGRWIAYKRGSPGDIWIMRPNGSSQQNLTTTPDLDEQFPAWLPDGRLSFVRGDGDNEDSYALWVTDSDRSHATLLFPKVSGWNDWTHG